MLIYIQVAKSNTYKLQFVMVKHIPHRQDDYITHADFHYKIICILGTV